MGRDRRVDEGRTRGSRRHVLDWVSSPGFPERLTALLEPTGALVSAGDVWMPRGWNAPDEARLETFGPRALGDAVDWSELTSWWLVHRKGANTPNWDLAATCSFGDRKGLVLVEAKAHERELHSDGKRLSTKASERSRQNHERIREAIAEASAGLDAVIPGISLSVDRCYQLANRVAFAWKLATLGVPVVLVYLGFLRAPNVGDLGTSFEDHAHWERCFLEHARGVLPRELLERRIELETGSMSLILRTLEAPAGDAAAGRPTIAGR